MAKKEQGSKARQDLSLSPQDHYLRNAFENMLEGFQIIGRDWSYLYINEVAARHGEKTVDELLGRRMMDAFPGIEKTTLFRTLKSCMTNGTARMLTNEFAYTDGHTRWFELRISPIPDGLSILSLDITERKLAEARVQRLTRTLTLLSNVNQSIVRIRDLGVLLKKICQIAVEDGGLALAWIGLLDEAEHKIQIMAKAGMGFGYLEKLDLHVGIQPVKNCPVDTAMRTGQHNVCCLANSNTSDLAPCQQNALESGFRSSASFPLFVNSEIRGAINLYSADPDFFDREEVRLLRDMSMNIGFAMEAAEDQAALVQNTIRLENAEIYAHLGNWEYDVRTGRVNWSKGMYSMFGLEERNGVPGLEEYLDIIHPEDRSILEEVVQQMARGQEPKQHEFRTHPDHGPVRHFLPTFVTLRDPESGDPIKFIVTQIDITEHKADKVTLRESESRYRSLFEDSPISLWEEDFSEVQIKLNALREQGVTDFAAYFNEHIDFVYECARLVRITDVNRATLKMYNAPDKSNFLTNLQEVFKNEPIQQFQNELTAIAEGKTAFGWEGINYTLEGKQLNVNLKWAAIPGHEQDLKKVIVSILDITDRVNAETAMRKSEERFRTLINKVSKIAVQGYGPDGTVRLWNKASEAIYGYTAEEALGRNLLDLIIPPSIRDLVREDIHEMVRRGEGRPSEELILMHKDGSPIHVYSSHTVLALEDQDRELFCIDIDMTDKNNAEEKLRTVFNAMEEGLALNQLVYDERGQIIDYRILEINPAYERFSGLSREQAVGRLATDIYEMSSDYIRSFWDQHLQDEHIVSEMYSEVKQQWWRISTSKPVDEKFVTVFFDITQHKNAENALRQSERSYRALVEQIPAIVYIDEVVNGKNRISFISPQLETIMGVKVEDWLRQGAQAWIKYQHPEDRARVNSMYMSFIHDGGVYDCEYRMIRDDGRIVWFHDKAVMIEASENGGRRQAHGVIYDVTQQKQVDAELRQRLKELVTLHTISVALRTAQSLEKVLPLLLDETLANLETEAGAILLHHPATHDLRGIVSRGWYKDLEMVNIPVGQGVAGTVFSSGKPYYSEEIQKDPLPIPVIRERIPPGWSGVCLPIHTDVDIVGVLFVSMQLPRKISPEQMRLLESLAEMAGAAIHRIRLHEETIHRLENLQALHEVDLAITSNFDLRPTLDIVIEHTIHQLKVDAVDILLLRKGLQTMEYVAGQGFRTPINKGASVRIGESFAGRAALERRTLYVNSLNEVHKNQPFGVFWKSEGFAAYYCVPLIAKGEVKGVMEVFNRSPILNDTEWIYYLETLAGQAAIAIDNTQLFENLQQANLELGVAYEATIEGWSRALDLRDQETEGHTQRVTEMTVDLAADFKFTPTELLSIRRGAILHDIGKISVPDSILRKPEALTQEESAIMRRHPQVAYEMLKPIHYLHESLDIPYCHHEKWDGTGYPRGLAGENIPLAARIFAVVDVYDALTNLRPYRGALPKQKALEYIREQSGAHFDPQVVEVFLRRFSNNL